MLLSQLSFVRASSGDTCCLLMVSPLLGLRVVRNSVQAYSVQRPQASIFVLILAVEVKVDLEGFSLQKSNPYFLYPKK